MKKYGFFRQVSVVVVWSFLIANLGMYLPAARLVYAQPAVGVGGQEFVMQVKSALQVLVEVDKENSAKLTQFQADTVGKTEELKDKEQLAGLVVQTVGAVAAQKPQMNAAQIKAEVTKIFEGIVEKAETQGQTTIGEIETADFNTLVSQMLEPLEVSSAGDKIVIDIGDNSSVLVYNATDKQLAQMPRNEANVLLAKAETAQSAVMPVVSLALTEIDFSADPGQILADLADSLISTGQSSPVAKAQTAVVTRELSAQMSDPAINLDTVKGEVVSAIEQKGLIGTGKLFADTGKVETLVNTIITSISGKAMEQSKVITKSANILIAQLGIEKSDALTAIMPQVKTTAAIMITGTQDQKTEAVQVLANNLNSVGVNTNVDNLSKDISTSIFQAECSTKEVVTSAAHSILADLGIGEDRAAVVMPVLENAVTAVLTGNPEQKTAAVQALSAKLTNLGAADLNVDELETKIISNISSVMAEKQEIVAQASVLAADNLNINITDAQTETILPQVKSTVAAVIIGTQEQKTEAISKLENLIAQETGASIEPGQIESTIITSISQSQIMGTDVVGKASAFVVNSLNITTEQAETILPQVKTTLAAVIGGTQKQKTEAVVVLADSLADVGVSIDNLEAKIDLGLAQAAINTSPVVYNQVSLNEFVTQKQAQVLSGQLPGAQVAAIQNAAAEQLNVAPQEQGIVFDSDNLPQAVQTACVQAGINTQDVAYIRVNPGDYKTGEVSVKIVSADKQSNQGKVNIEISPVNLNTDNKQDRAMLSKAAAGMDALDTNIANIGGVLVNFQKMLRTVNAEAVIEPISDTERNTPQVNESNYLVVSAKAFGQVSSKTEQGVEVKVNGIATQPMLNLLSQTNKIVVVFEGEDVNPESFLTEMGYETKQIEVIDSYNVGEFEGKGINTASTITAESVKGVLEARHGKLGAVHYLVANEEKQGSLKTQVIEMKKQEGNENVSYSLFPLDLGKGEVINLDVCLCQAVSTMIFGTGNNLTTEDKKTYGAMIRAVLGNNSPLIINLGDQQIAEAMNDKLQSISATSTTNIETEYMTVYVKPGKWA